jgi:CRP-like cAMP-binding protein
MVTRRTGRTDRPTPDEWPALRALPMGREEGRGTQLLTETQREELVRIATPIQLAARTVLYREGAPAEHVYIIMSGVMKAFRDLRSGKRRINAFLFARDLIGLAEEGRYSNTLQAIDDVALYQVRLDALSETLRADGDLQFTFLNKITHELREAQRHLTIVSRRDAAGRLAMFLEMIRRQVREAGGDTTVIPLQMSRGDIAAYLALSPESLSRATATLERRGLVAFESKRQARLLDVERFELLVNAG